MLSQSLLPEFDHEMASTRKVLERIPQADLDWKPHEKSFSMHDLSLHLANIPSWVTTTFEQDVLDLSQSFEHPEGGSKEAILSLFDESVPKARAHIENASDEAMGETWKLTAGDQELFSAPRAGVLRSFVLSHMIHHRGQLTVYLRLRGVPLPEIYGPTADEDSFSDVPEHRERMDQGA